MTILNRRNAVVGWAVIKAGKFLAEGRQSSSGKPSRKRSKVKLSAGAVALGVAAGVLLLRHRRGPGPEDAI